MRPLLRNRSAQAKPPRDDFLTAWREDARLDSQATRTITARTQIATITMNGSESRLLTFTCLR